MASVRHSFQGVWNIIRFNWHFYFLSFVLSVLIFLFAQYLNKTIQLYCCIIGLLIVFGTFISLLVSYYVYDVSGLYQLNWLDKSLLSQKQTIVNINAGFDEISVLLQHQFSNASLMVLDFYNPIKHTEISIKRARKAYPPFPGTLAVNTASLPIADDSADRIFLILSAHEIRNETERVIFFKELHRILKPSGQIIIVEHVRNMANFLAYNIGFLHFYSRNTWFKTFQLAAFKINNEQKITPFISIFTLQKNGITS